MGEDNTSNFTSDESKLSRISGYQDIDNNLSVSPLSPEWCGVEGSKIKKYHYQIRLTNLLSWLQDLSGELSPQERNIADGFILKALEFSQVDIMHQRINQTYGDNKISLDCDYQALAIIQKLTMNLVDFLKVTTDKYFSTKTKPTKKVLRR